MTVNDLIIKLREMPEDMPVVVRGYEGGYDDINGVKMLKLNLNPNAWNPSYKDYFWYLGVYEHINAESEGDSFDAVFIEQFDESNKHRLKRETFLSETV